jgi:hypothetical protein
MRPKSPKAIHRFLCRAVFRPVLIASISLVFSMTVLAGPSTPRIDPSSAPPYVIAAPPGGGASTGFGGRPYWTQTPSREDPRRMQRQYQEWQSLPPEQKDAMRRRMDDVNRMPPQERDRYQQRYQQWQQLSPEERRRIENDLQRWDRLSPQERDSIQKRFKR